MQLPLSHPTGIFLPSFWYITPMNTLVHLARLEWNHFFVLSSVLDWHEQTSDELGTIGFMAPAMDDKTGSLRYLPESICNVDATLHMSLGFDNKVGAGGGKRKNAEWVLACRFLQFAVKSVPKSSSSDPQTWNP